MTEIDPWKQLGPSVRHGHTLIFFYLVFQWVEYIIFMAFFNESELDAGSNKFDSSSPM